LLRAIEWQPNHPKANYLLGKIYLNESKPKEAAEAFLRAEQTDPSNPDVLNGAGVAQDMLGLHKLAQRYYLRAQTSGRGDPAVIRTNLGLSYLLSGEPKLAVEQLKPEAKKATAPAATRHNLALAYGMLGKNAEARALVKNEMSEEDRLLALERLKKYIAQEGPAPAAPNTPGGPKGAGAR
jgi:Flp pilus assembly protein TadD